MTRSRRTTLLLLVGFALVAEAAMRTPVLRGGILQNVALAHLHAGRTDAALASFDRLVQARGRTHDHSLRGVALTRMAHFESGGRDLLVGLLTEDAEQGSFAQHALSGHHLMRAGVVGPPREPGAPPAEGPDAARTAGPRAAYLAAREALRADPDNAAARWNLYLAIQAGGTRIPTPPQPASSTDGARSLREILQRGVRAVETSAIQQSLPAILRAMEARVPQPRRVGPPW